MLKFFYRSLLVVCLIFFTNSYSQSVSVGQTAPDFQLSRFGGGTLSLDDYSGTIVFIYFFGAT